jgi:hypothetical protein
MALRDTKTKEIFLVVGSILAIGASVCWITLQQRAPNMNVSLHQAVGRVMAEETARLLGGKGQVAIVSMETARVPELKTQLQAFEKALQRMNGITVLERYELDPEDKPKYGAGTGLSAGRFLRIVKKSAKADVIVSFVGVPRLTDEEMEKLDRMPKFLAEAKDRDKLTKLMEKKLLQVAVVPRFEFPAPVSEKPRSAREWFDKYFQVVTSN